MELLELIQADGSFERRVDNRGTVQIQAGIFIWLLAFRWSAK